LDKRLTGRDNFFGQTNKVAGLSKIRKSKENATTGKKKLGAVKKDRTG